MYRYDYTFLLEFVLVSQSNIKMLLRSVVLYSFDSDLYYAMSLVVMDFSLSTSHKVVYRGGFLTLDIIPIQL